MCFITIYNHVGSMAQDFYAAFKLGNDEKGISTIDADGIVLAAVKERNKQNQELKRELQNR